MQFLAAESYEQLSQWAAERVIAQVNANPHSVLGLPTGSTAIGMYAELVAAYHGDIVSFRDVTTFNLDEYCGLAPENPQSYHYFMNEHLFKYIDIKANRVHIPDGLVDDPALVCGNYELAIREAGGIDLQVLGLGNNGHIGFNEPDDHFPVRTHCVDLTPSTREANSRLFNSIDEVPWKAYTMGVGTIMQAREILVLVSGAQKAKILKEVMEGPVKPEVPASILQMHRDVTIIADKEAATQLI